MNLLQAPRQSNCPQRDAFFRKGAMAGGDQDNFALIPITTGMNRYANTRQSISILVQAQEPASYDDTVEQVRGIMRTARKVPPDKHRFALLCASGNDGLQVRIRR